MKRYKIVYERNSCIGAGTCVAVDPDDWVMAPDNKADLMKSHPSSKPDVFEREIDESELEINLEAAKACPVNCIHIIDQKEKKQLV